MELPYTDITYVDDYSFVRLASSQLNACHTLELIRKSKIPTRHKAKKYFIRDNEVVCPRIYFTPKRSSSIYPDTHER